MIKYYEHQPIEPNVGDSLSGLILKHFLPNEELFEVGKEYEGKIVSCGSVMSYLKEGDTVWGTGVIRAEDKVPMASKCNFLAVRGKLTADIVKKSGGIVPDVYGDPALLLPLIYPKSKKNKKYSVGYIPHYVDRSFVKAGKDETIIDVSLPVEEFIDRILECEKIVSSSLHGIVISEAYGIPVEWIQYSNKLTGGKFKFHDYLTGTNREPQEPGDFPPIPNLKEIQDKLIVALTKPRICVITRMHYPKDHKDFKWRFEYYKNKVLPTLRNQTFKQFDIAVWCEKHHEKLFKELGVIPFQATHPEYNSELFKDFTSWDNVSGLKRYDIQVALDSDDLVEPQFLAKIRQICVGSKSIHISFQPDKLNIKTGKLYKMSDNYKNSGTGSPCYALYQPEFKYFAYHDSHLKIGNLMDKTIYIDEGYVHMSIHDTNDSTGIKKTDIEIKRNNKMDVCYILHSENEAKEILRYSIRSVEQNLDYRDIYIVGRKPEFLNSNTKELFVQDKNVDNRFINITNKLWAIINDPRISENFIVMNDDMYIMKEFKKIPYYYIGKISTYQKQLSEVFTGGHWKKILTQQLKAFPNGNMFTPHFPIVYNKKKLAKLLMENRDARDGCVRSWYCNTYKIKGEKIVDKKIYKDEHLHLYKNASFLSSSDWIENKDYFLNFLKSKFPEPSRYEYKEETILYFLANISQINEMFNDIINNKDYMIIVGTDKCVEDTLKNSGIIDGYLKTSYNNIEYVKKQIESRLRTTIRETKVY